MFKYNTYKPYEMNNQNSFNSAGYHHSFTIQYIPIWYCRITPKAALFLAFDTF